MKDKTKKITISVIIFIVVGVIAVTSYFMLKPKPQPNLIMRENIIFEYGQSLYKEDSYDFDVITIDDFVDKENEETIYDEVSFEEIVIGTENLDDDQQEEYKNKKIDLDTSKVGKDLKVIIYARLDNEIKEFEASYAVEDTQSPKFTGEFDITITKGDMLDLNEYVKASDPVDGPLTIEFDNYEFDVGTHTVIAKANDKNNKKTIQEITITVNERIVEQEGTLVGDNGDLRDSTSDFSDTDNLLILVNKKYPLPSNYNPGENSVAKKNLLLLIESMKSSALDVSDYYSGYRSYEHQKNLYKNYVKQHGEAEANTFSARPGYSEHQLGLTFDLFHNDGQFLQYEPEASWLIEHAHRFGFIVRYQEKFEHITGYIAEPWHIRYVGEHATKIKELEITLEEYLGVY